MQGHSSMHRQQVAASVGRESVCRLSKEANSGSLIFVELEKNMDGQGVQTCSMKLNVIYNKRHQRARN